MILSKRAFWSFSVPLPFLTLFLASSTLLDFLVFAEAAFLVGTLLTATFFL